MAGKKGDSFMTQPPFEIIAALVFTFLIIGFIIAQSGGVSSILKSVCDKIPDLCAGSVSTADYQIAKQSKQELTCAISTVLSGKPQCVDVKPVPSITGQQTANANPSVGSASVSCAFKKGYPEIEYEEDCGTLNPACHHENVWYVLNATNSGSTEWMWKCPDCGEKYFSYQPLSAMGQVINDVDKVHVEIKNNLDIVNKQNINADEKFSKGVSDAFVKVITAAKDKYGGDDWLTLYHKSGASEKFDASNIRDLTNSKLENLATCKVSSFTLPETFAGMSGKAKEFIPVAGDPSFLVYYQRFPVGEDADWSDQSPWFRDVGKVMFLGMCALDVFTGMRAGKTALTGFVKETGAKIIKTVEKKLGITAANEAAAKAAAEQAERLTLAAQADAIGIGGKVEGEAIVQFLKQDSMNSAIIRYLKNKYPNLKDPADVFQAAVGADRTMTQEAYKELYGAFRTAWDGKSTMVDLSRILENKADPAFLTELLGKVQPDAVSRFTKYVGIDTVTSYYLARFDSEIGKFIKLHSNSLVLGMPAVKEEPEKLFSNVIQKPKTIDYPETQSLVNLGRPVVLLKAGFGNSPTPFYLASPCKADLTVDMSTLSCGSYTYDSIGGESSCSSPTENENSKWYKALLNGRLPNCGSLAEGNNDYIFNRFKATATGIVNNLNNAGTFGEVSVGGDPKIRRIEISDPIEGLKFYYNKDAQVIDFIGASIGTKGGDGKDTGAFIYKQWTVKELFDYASSAGNTYWLLNSKDDNRSLYFDKNWAEPSTDPCNLMTSEPPVVSTDKGTTGFSCQKRKLNKDVIERFMSGEDETDPTGNDYIVCNSPEIRDADGSNIFISQWRIYVDAATGNFYGMYVSKGDYYFVLTDSNLDGKVDRFGQFYRFTAPGSAQGQEVPGCVSNIGYENFQFRVFDDKNFDGQVDGVTSSNCNVPGAVTISVSNAVKDENGNSYCYRSKSGTWGVASTVALFGVSAVSKFGGGWGLAAGIGVDCGIAVIEIWNPGNIIKSSWPDGGYLGMSKYTP
jgi:predicted  nucleic acid-binding Zn-ribbon protein